MLSAVCLRSGQVSNMADVRELRNYKSLYKCCVHVITVNFKILRSVVKYLPENVLCDIYYKLYEENSLGTLVEEFSNLEVFIRVLKIGNCHLTLHRCFQTLEEHGAELGAKLCKNYSEKAKNVCNDSCLKNRLDIVDAGLRLGGFLSDAAWYDKAEIVLLACQEVCEILEDTPANKRLLLHCCHKLLQVQALYCNLQGAQKIYEKTLSVLEDLSSTNNAPNLAGIYAVISDYFFIKSEFDDSYRYSLQALHELKPSVPAKVTVDVLRQASKAFVVKREFVKAGILSRQAVDLAAEVFGFDHPKYADAQLNYGFFLLNFDSIHPCVEVYESAHSIKSSVFKKNNIHVALALEDLAYALYVREYISGRFEEAQEKADEAIRIKEKLLPPDHIMLSSAKRVKALILEEIAIDNSEEQSQRKLLAQAEEFHLIALSMTMKVYGEKNLQTAKHYGNLGRLCQSMKKFKEAEQMHIKAISIKEELLGPDHLEVGLSVGHLASLYNYHMGEYHKAKDLYMRSISISTKLLGSRYSGLEFDYRGLVHVYTNLNDPEKAAEYSYLLNSWRMLRKHRLEKYGQTFTTHQPPKPILQVIQEVLNPTPIQPSVSAY